MKVNMTPAEFSFLLISSQQGPMTAYDMAKKSKYTEKTAYTTTKSLVEQGMLTREIIGKTRAGKDKINYILTLRGIMWVFVMPSTSDLWKNAITWWTHLAPLVFGKWEILETVNEFYSKLRLGWAVKMLIPEYEFTQEPPLDSFYRHFYGVYTNIIEDSARDIHIDWLRQVCNKDLEISTFIINTLEQKQSQAREWLQLLQDHDH